MKTFCLTLGLLLLTFCCYNAMPAAIQYNTAPVNCCVKFSTFQIPSHRVAVIKKTHISCLRKGFIVETVLKKKLCYASNFAWAQNLFKQSVKTEGSGSQ